MLVCSALFIQSHDRWFQPDQRFKRADESLVSCMLIGCLFLKRPFCSIRGEYGGSTPPCLGCIDCFQQMERAISNTRVGPTLSLVPPTRSWARTSGLMWQNQSRCDSAPPVSSSREPKFIGLNKDLTQSYSLCFQTGSGTVSKRKASDTEVSKNRRCYQLIIELTAVFTFDPP